MRSRVGAATSTIEASARGFGLQKEVEDVLQEFQHVLEEPMGLIPPRIFNH